MRHGPLLGVAFLLGCGPATLAPFSDSDVDAAPAFADVPDSADPCDPERTLVIQLVTDSATLSRDLSDAGYRAGTFLPAFDVRPFGLEEDDRVMVISAIQSMTEQRLTDFGISVMAGETALNVEEAPPVDVIARVVITDLPGAPQHCGCQGSTSQLGLPSDGPAEAVVFSNAYVQNGLAAVLGRYGRADRVALLAAALSNSVLHEIGHTLGLVHVDVAGQPMWLMARGGASSTKVSLAAMTALQRFSDEALPVTADALTVRQTQCDTCIIEATLAARRMCLK